MEKNNFFHAIGYVAKIILLQEKKVSKVIFVVIFYNAIFLKNKCNRLQNQKNFLLLTCDAINCLVHEHD